MNESWTFNTLFMLISLDGKISTGSADERDVDKDYKLEKQTDRYSFNTGRVMAKIGVNTENIPMHAVDVNSIILNNNHLTEQGVRNFADIFTKLKKQGAERVTIQSGGTINSILIRKKLIDRISVVIAPALVGGKDTASLVDGKSITTLVE